MNLVIVESPAKAKTINKYLGGEYTVLASYGHIRDLPSKNGSVNPEDKFKMIWEVDSFSKKYLKEITDAAKKSKKIILATDPDREGEAIAWHLLSDFRSKKLIEVSFKRDLYLVVGPEGGFSDEELKCVSKKAEIATLGPRTLRSETAPVVALSILQSKFGDLS